MPVWFLESTALSTYFTKEPGHQCVEQLLDNGRPIDIVVASPLAAMEIMYTMRLRLGNATSVLPQVNQLPRMLDNLHVLEIHRGITSIENGEAEALSSADLINPIAAIQLADFYQRAARLGEGSTSPSLLFVSCDPRLVELVRRAGFSAIDPCREQFADFLEIWNTVT